MFPLLLFKRRWLPATLLVLFASAVMIRLGFWQLDRLAQKRAYIANAQAALAAAPLPISGSEIDLDPQVYLFRSATAGGVYDFEHEVLLKNQNYHGDRPGFHLLTPLRIEGSDRALLVDRGWVPYEDVDPDNLQAYQEPGPQSITGQIEPAETRPSGAKLPSTFERQWYRVDIEWLQKQTPYELLPFYVALTPTPDRISPPFRNPPEIILDEGPHMGYAIQWFLFAIVVPIVYAVQVRKIDRRQTETQPASIPL